VYVPPGARLVTGIIGRRSLLALLVAAWTGASRLSARAAMAVATGTLAPAITPDQFLALSSRLTGHRELDPILAGAYLQPLVATPATAALLAGLIDGSERTAAHAALEREIIEAWYTGVHQVDGARVVATHSGALVWHVLGRPAPGTCASVMGDWAKAPEERAR
jgi:hypothetical protein